jgi:ZIP family zinc transporter
MTNLLATSSANDLFSIIVYTAVAAACIPLGGMLARFEHIHPCWLENEFRHFIIAFGGGVLVAAVALVLVPEGMRHVASPAHGTLWMVSGGLTFFWMERVLGRQRRESPQLSAMLLDFIPESLALGGIFATGAHSAPLLALLIGLQNLPEGFNAFREIHAHNGGRDERAHFMMMALIPVGPAFGVLGWSVFDSLPYLLGAVMLFAAGGILYLVFQDIAPQSRLKRHWAPPLGAVLGFALAVQAKALLPG